MILILNCGSQSIKWKLYDKKLRLIKEGKRSALRRSVFKHILKKELKEIGQDVELVGHRVVHGGRDFREPIKITKEVLRDLKKINRLAPLHNPYNLLGIKVCRRVFPKAENIAVFDTEFYKDLPEKSYLYLIPEDLRKEFRRYGFHGISHEFAAKTAAKKSGKDFEKIKIISCHLGGGSSITAIKNGKAIETSMGFTPMEGVAMMTRAGDIDSGVVLELARRYSVERVRKILNRQSGLKAICGEDEMLEILKRKDKKAKLALEIFADRIKKYIGAYYAVLNGCDLLVFTGTIGAGDPRIRKMILKDMDFLKGVKAIVIEPDEELAIAQKLIKF